MSKTGFSPHLRILKTKQLKKSDFPLFFAHPFHPFIDGSHEMTIHDPAMGSHGTAEALAHPSINLGASPDGNLNETFNQDLRI